MNEILTSNSLAPVRANIWDQPADILHFAAFEADDKGAALAMLVDIRGGAARALGAPMAIAADGRFCGYVSGGCVEAAVAAEAAQALFEGRDRTVMFGEGSPFFDIVLPCGGGITVAIHIVRDSVVLWNALQHIQRRDAAALRYNAQTQTLCLAKTLPARAGWRGDDFMMVYRPCTRLLISGQPNEVGSVARIAEAAGYDVVLANQADWRNYDAEIDAFTAVLLLHHDLDLEIPVLKAALASRAFYIGALGSARTHRRRLDILAREGVDSVFFDRIKAPIGIFGPTRDSISLALSVLADVAACRLEIYA